MASTIGLSPGSSTAERVHRHYLVYGQRLCSDIPLPELCPSPSREVDIVLRSAASIESVGEGGDCRLLTVRHTNLGCDLHVYQGSKGVLLRWQGHCDFHISRSGSRVIVAPGPGVEGQWATATIYGLVLSFALHLMGVGSLHASAVVLPAGAVGFLAAPGGGKSSLAAWLASHGAAFLTDDVLALQVEADGYLVYPGFPFVSLNACALEGLDVQPRGQRPPDASSEAKARVPVDGGWASFHEGPAPLRALLVLAREEARRSVCLERLGRQEALRVLLEHTSCFPLLPVQCVRRQMAFLSRLTGPVPVWRLRYPTGFQHLPAVAQQVLDAAGRG